MCSKVGQLTGHKLCQCFDRIYYDLQDICGQIVITPESQSFDCDDDSVLCYDCVTVWQL